jgi:transcriptional regulator with XRE-family HTH domain
MDITDEAAAILSPTEMREARQLAGLSLSTLARYSNVCVSQLCEFENRLNGLRADQLHLCREILLGAVVERAEQIQTFIAREQQKAAQSTALRYAN